MKSNKKLMVLLEQLDMYLSAGLSIDISLRIIEDSMSGESNHLQFLPKRLLSNRFTISIKNIRKDVESGVNISTSLEKNIKISNSLVNIIKHGESAGHLSEAIKSVHELMVREEELKSKCLSAMYYPLVIGFIAVLMTIGLMQGVVPQMLPMLKGMNVELPLLTRMVMWLSATSSSYGIYVLLAIITTSFSLPIIYRKVLPLRVVTQTVLGKIPMIGRLIYLYFLSNTIRSIGMMVSSGLSVTRSYADVVGVIPFIPLRRALTSKITDLESGIPLHKVLASKKTPEHVIAMILAGESTGTLGEALIRSANVIDIDMSSRLKRLTALIEPLMMVLIGLIVGSISLSIMMPIYDMSKILQHAH